MTNNRDGPEVSALGMETLYFTQSKHFFFDCAYEADFTQFNTADSYNKIASD